MKNKKFIVPVAILAIVLFGYLVFRVRSIFGPWNIIWTALLSTILSKLADMLMGSRKVKGNEIIYNPIEFPKYISILASLLIGYYLFTVMNEPTISKINFSFGIIYLLLVTILPPTFAAYKLIRDRNDYITISDQYLNYRDNKIFNEFKLEDIKSVEASDGIKLTFKNNETHIIKVKQMNFNAKDFSRAIIDIKKKLS